MLVCEVVRTVRLSTSAAPVNTTNTRSRTNQSISPARSSSAHRSTLAAPAPVRDTSETLPTSLARRAPSETRAFHTRGPAAQQRTPLATRSGRPAAPQHARDSSADLDPEKDLEAKGFDSVAASASAGGLRAPEFVLYRTERVVPRYVLAVAQCGRGEPAELRPALRARPPGEWLAALRAAAAAAPSEVAAEARPGGKGGAAPGTGQGVAAARSAPSPGGVGALRSPEERTLLKELVAGGTRVARRETGGWSSWGGSALSGERLVVDAERAALVFEHLGDEEEGGGGGGGGGGSGQDGDDSGGGAFLAAVGLESVSSISPAPAASPPGLLVEVRGSGWVWSRPGTVSLTLLPDSTGGDGGGGGGGATLEARRDRLLALLRGLASRVPPRLREAAPRRGGAWLADESSYRAERASLSPAEVRALLGQPEPPTSLCDCFGAERGASARVVASSLCDCAEARASCSSFLSGPPIEVRRRARSRLWRSPARALSQLHCRSSSS